VYFKEIIPYGDRGLILDFGQQSSKSISQEVNTYYRHLKGLSLSSTNIVPSFNKIVISFYSGVDREQSLSKIQQEISQINTSTSPQDQSTWTIPVCYEDSFALDMKRIQELHDLSKEEIIKLHSSSTYYTYYIGFMPGFPYLGDIHPSLITPRLESPRIQIPARSVGIAKEHTCIYPKVSPGGWNIIGQVPFDLFSLEHPRTSLFLPGDEVKFHAINQKEYESIHRKNLSLDALIKEYSS
jgi:inhibitor of KinA